VSVDCPYLNNPSVYLTCIIYLYNEHVITIPSHPQIAIPETNIELKEAARIGYDKYPFPPKCCIQLAFYFLDYLFLFLLKCLCHAMKVSGHVFVC
jgi:hypothetical protein